jgi:hypothetical protein
MMDHGKQLNCVGFAGLKLAAEQTPLQKLAGSPEVVYSLNLWVSIVVVIVVLLVLGHYAHQSHITALNRFKARVLILWSGWWVSLIGLYLLFNAALPSEPTGETDLKLHGLALAVIDTGSASMLCLAIAYSKGLTFSWKHVHRILYASAILIVWDIVTGQYYESPLQRLVAIAPSSVLTNSWIISVGWAFYVRWGSTAFPFLLLTIAYAALQLPAYLYAFVVEPFGATMPALELQFANLVYIYWWLFIGKVAYAAMFLLLFFSPEPYSPDLTVEQLVPPRRPVKLYPRYKVALTSVLVIFGSAFAAAAASVFSEATKAFLASLGFPVPNRGA